MGCCLGFGGVRGWWVFVDVWGLQVNPGILGGLIVDFGEKTIDLSVQSRVTKLNNILQRMFYSVLFILFILFVTLMDVCVYRIGLKSVTDYNARGLEIIPPSHVASFVPTHSFHPSRIYIIEYPPFFIALCV